MAFLNLSKLKDSIESSFTALKKVWQGDGPTGSDHPIEVDNVNLANINPANFSKTLDYTFSVVYPNNANFPLFMEFPLPISPQNINFQEPIPTKIKATQGGTAVFRNGLKYRTISIKGTTGIFPRRGVYGVSKNGQNRSAANTEDAEGVKSASGFESFKRLQNWFRAFYLYTKEKPDGKDLRLVFNNYREGEFWIVELISFTQDQDSSNPLHMVYTIQLKVLGAKKAPKKDPLTGLAGALSKADAWYEGAIDKIDQVRAVFMGAQDILRQVESNVDAALLEPLRKTSIALKAASNTASSFADLGPGVVKKFATRSTVIAAMLGVKKFQASQEVSSDPKDVSIAELPVNIEASASSQGVDLLLNLPPDVQFNTSLDEMPENMLKAHEQDKIDARNLPRKYFQDVLSEMNRIRDNAADKFGMGSSDYDALEDRTSTTTSSEFKTPTDREFEVLAAFELAQSAYNDLLTSQLFFKETYQDQVNRLNEAFGGVLEIEAKPSVRDYIIPSNITLEEIALFELQDSARWVEIAELNNMLEPYIVQNKQEKVDGVFSPGDKILIPSGGSSFGEIPIFRDSPLLDDLTQLERSMGIDLKMNEDGDLELTNTGDLAIVRGLDNALQAIVTKLKYSKGDLMEHPDIGVGLKVGSKQADVGEVRAAIVDSLTSDPRFEKITGLAILKEGNTLRINFSLKLRNVNQPIPLELRV